MADFCGFLSLPGLSPLETIGAGGIRTDLLGSLAVSKASSRLETGAPLSGLDTGGCGRRCCCCRVHACCLASMDAAWASFELA